MKQFKIIAVRPLKNCLKHYRKTLNSETTYFLYNGYKDAEYESIVRDDSNLIPNDFFRTQYGNDQLSVSISSIVGKNGDGKSSVIELVIRILNNFSYAAGFQKNHKDLKPVFRLYAKLFYSIGDVIYSIAVKNNAIYWESDKFCLKWELSAPNVNNYKDVKEIEEFLFYTQISNYSIYAYNSEEFKRENNNSNECWINGVFHKNDGYQTPIVLNPWRDRGCVDVNKERNLMKDRLISLFLSNPNFRTINQKQYAKSLKIKPSKFSKLERKTLYDFYKYEYENNYKEDASAVIHIQNIIKELRSEQLPVIEFRYDDVRDITDRLEVLDDQINLNRELFIKSIKVKKEFVSKEKIRIKTDFRLFLNKIRELSNIIKQKVSSDKNFENVFKDISSKLEYLSVKMMSKLNIEGVNLSTISIIELQRILLISYYKKEWYKYLDKLEIHPSIKGNADILEIILNYLVYKSVSIIEKYPTFKEFYKVKSPSDFIKLGELDAEIKNNHLLGLKQIWNDIEVEKTHITLKIRQVLCFITGNPYGKDKKIFNGEGLMVDFSEYFNKIEKHILKWSIMELLPPPIFDTEVVIEQIDSKESSLLFDLSSGERQLLNVISSIIYHLQNISSVKKNKENIISYKNVCLILEEIELYFHPEFQRTFIKLLLDSIYLSQIKNIESIHICFLTHSPFILSDIPNNNILYLKRGKSEDKKENKTFAANIHEMLSHNFFMESTIGKYAEEKIRQIIELYNQYKNDSPSWRTAYEEKKDYFQFVLNQVGEDYLRKMLNNMLLEMDERSQNKSYIEQLIKQKEQEITSLKSRLNDKN